MKVASFTIDHDRLERGIYVSRIDHIGAEAVTTFDIRMKRPNVEPFIDVPAMHTLEHLFAVYLRGESGDWADEVVYIGPMGCRTGVYLILKGERTPREILPLVRAMVKYTMDFQGQVPATTSKECGNYLDHNLAIAQWEARKFYDETLETITDAQMTYPT